MGSFITSNGQSDWFQSGLPKNRAKPPKPGENWTGQSRTRPVCPKKPSVLEQGIWNRTCATVSPNTKVGRYSGENGKKLLWGFNRGLAITLAESAFGADLGAKLQLAPVLGASGLSPAELLFSESASRLLVTVAPQHQPAFEALFAGTPCYPLGLVTQEPQLVALNGPTTLFDEPLDGLKTAWQGTLGGRQASAIVF